MKYIFFLVALSISLTAFAQDFNIHHFRDRSKSEMVHLFSSNGTETNMLKLLSKNTLLYCKVNDGEESCSPVENYEEYISDAKIFPFGIREIKDGQYALFSYKKVKGRKKEIYRSQYSMQENTLSKPVKIHTVSGYKNSNNFDGLFRLIVSEDESQVAIVEYCLSLWTLTQGSNGLMTVIYLDENLEKESAVTETLDYKRAELFPNPKGAFKLNAWPYLKYTLTNEGNFYTIIEQGQKMFVNHVNKAQQKIIVEEFSSEDFNRILPTINYSAKNGIELWSIIKDRQSNQINFVVHQSREGEKLKKMNLQNDPNLESFLELDNEDKYVKITQVIQTNEGGLYISAAPVSSFPSKIESYGNNFKVQGLFVLAVKENKITPIHKKRFTSKHVFTSGQSKGFFEFSWGFECNNKLLFFYNDNKSKDFLYKNNNGKIKAIVVDILSEKGSDLNYSIDQQTIYIDDQIPFIFLSREKEFAILYHKLKTTKDFFFISPVNSSKIYKM